MGFSFIKSILVPLLIFSITFCQILPSWARDDDKDIRVVFVGIKFKNVPEQIREIISWRMTAILDTQESLILTKPDAARIVYGRKKMSELIEKQSLEAFLAFAEQYKFDHVFSGNLVNQSADSDKVFLVGELSRYDLATGNTNIYKISKDYDKFGNELIKFKEQYVESLLNNKDSERQPWSLLVVGGIAIAAVIVTGVLLSAGGAKGNESEQGSDN